MKAGANIGRALQHFVTQSPWDHTRVLARYRELLAPDRLDKAAVWVVHDEALLKKGRNSVGKQRQYARSLGRKANCQIAVTVGVSGPSGYLPLDLRLFLPGYWLRENPRLVEKVVPAAHRGHTTKCALALELLDGVRAEGWSATGIALDEGYAATAGLADALVDRGVRPAGAETAAVGLASAGNRFEWLKSRLGLDHFEGRTWTGWHHHAAMVLTGAGFLLTDSQ